MSYTGAWHYYDEMGKKYCITLFIWLIISMYNHKNKRIEDELNTPEHYGFRNCGCRNRDVILRVVDFEINDAREQL